MKLQTLLLFHVGLLSCGIASAAAVRYVDASNLNPARPYTNWLTAATNIQDAIGSANPGDFVLVSNGVYEAGGLTVSSLSNRVALTKPLTVQSVNGPAVTKILGSRSNPFVRCAYLTNGTTLSGFTLTNGGVPSFAVGGGGAFSLSYPLFTPPAVLTNCVLIGNSASYDGGGACGVVLYNCIVTGNTAGAGGGVVGCGLDNCTISSNSATGTGPVPSMAGCGGGALHCNMTNCLIVGNSAVQAGGGVCDGSLANCTIASNSAPSSGGVNQQNIAALTNCVIYYNSAAVGPNYQSGPAFSHCCTTPLPAGPGNFTNDPALANPAAGDFHLQTNSPCINAGLNFAISSVSDLDGNPRISGGTVDIGAYEFPNPASIISYAWLLRYGLPPDGSADFLDSDGDGMNNWQEWRAGTIPTNPLSVLRISSLTFNGKVSTVRWQSASDVTYTLERSTNLFLQPPFLLVQSNIPGTGNAVTCQDTNLSTIARAFYRLSLQ